MDPNAPDLAEEKKRLNQLGEDLKEIIVGMHVTADLSLNVELTKKFYPETKGKLIELLSSWQQELSDKLEEANQPTRESNTRY